MFLQSPSIVAETIALFLTDFHLERPRYSVQTRCAFFFQFGFSWTALIRLPPVYNGYEVKLTADENDRSYWPYKYLFLSGIDPAEEMQGVPILFKLEDNPAIDGEETPSYKRQNAALRAGKAIRPFFEGTSDLLGALGRLDVKIQDPGVEAGSTSE